ncbi:MAG: hypothetical protein U0800_00760 [Isosphaeraceae bacterium]
MIPGRLPVLDIAFSPDGSMLAVADERGYLSIYDTESWRAVACT